MSFDMEDLKVSDWTCSNCGHQSPMTSFEYFEKMQSKIDKLEKQNRYLRSSLNRLCGEVSNGEHISKEWIEQTLMEEPSCHLTTALNKELSKAEKQLEEAEKEISFYGDKDSWEIPAIDPITGWGGMSARSNIEHDRGKRAREYFKNKGEK